jgi:general secretion pathway protein A
VRGGFALISADPGTGKSVVLRLLAERLQRLREIAVGAMTHPSSNLTDFYREMAD